MDILFALHSIHIYQQHRNITVATPHLKWCGYFYWKCVSGISNVKTPAKNEKNSPVPAGYTLDKNNVPYKKETG
nr:amidase [Staphylococcus aureus]